MVFSSAVFLFQFLPYFLICYFLTPKAYKNYTALLGSLFFYSWGGPVFLQVLLFSVTIDYFLARFIDRVEDKSKKKVAMAISLIVNVGVLLYFKYANFFIENVNDVLGDGAAIEWTKVVLPIGISFFTFQKMSYVIDVYRGQHKALKNWFDFALYIFLFPQLIAGPIVRYKDIADQLRDRSHFLNAEYRMEGMMRFIIGLSKKLLIANIIGKEVANGLGMIYSLDTLDSWIILVGYSMQIYFDFSGYSDMAIGLGKMMGFQFPENFNVPYISRSITEFWQRWHMTLGAWMKDYLYIPLGGNRVSTGRIYINLVVVFLLSGMWHGASWNYVIWGGFHGIFLMLDRLFLGKFLKSIGKVPAILITYFLVLIGWAIFRMENLSKLGAWMSNLFGMERKLMSLIKPYEFRSEYFTMLGIALVISFLPMIWKKPMEWIYGMNKSSKGLNILRLIVMCILFLLCFGEVFRSNFNPFIYFRF